MTLLFAFLREEAGYVRTADRAGALYHSPAFIVDLDFAAFDLSLSTALDAISFEIHLKTSYGKKWLE